MPNNRRRQNKRKKTGGKSAANNGGRGQSQSLMKQPRYYPIVTFSRTVTSLYDINCTGIAPSLGVIAFALDQLPAYTEFSNLFQSYRLMRVKLTWRPEYTELTDAALVSNAVNVTFNTAIDQTLGTSPATVDDVLQYQNCMSTGITKTHTRTFKPAIIMNNGMVCTDCFLSVSNPNELHYGIQYAIPPTGVAMVFRSTMVMKFQCAGSR